MRAIFNLSFRYKMPLWGSFLIVTTAIIISATLLFRAYADLKVDLLRNAASQGNTLAISLFKALLHDDVWRAYEIITAPFHGATPEFPVQAETLLVVNRTRHVYVSTRPEEIPMLTPLARIAPDYALLEASWNLRDGHTRVIEPEGAGRIFVVTPIVEESAEVGTLIQVFSKSVLIPRFLESADRAAMMAGLVLTILLPINWYWGRRTAEPLATVADSMESLARGEPQPLPAHVYAYHDEVGRLFESYNRTAEQLRAKASLEQEVLRSERLAAIGRLAAGIAHEVNNPLAGMLTAIDTLKQRADLDPKVLKTVGLVERGLNQIADAVRALLVEAKVQSRSLAPEDVSDVQTLLHAQIARKGLVFEWRVNMASQVSLPASLFRQVLINLVLNAIQAAPEGGHAGVVVSVFPDRLTLDVRNEGPPLSDELLQHLFEPFMTTRESGHGLGLWVTYQIVRQLGGHIRAENEDAAVRFFVQLPLENAA
ncbi:MAG: HAMP domain-containing sensor histidine kinase [Rhodocyclaceae bacterium]